LTATTADVDQSGDAIALPSIARSTASMTVLTAVSRLTGFARVVVVAAVLGDTFLGNTYQSANTVPNIVFELVAAGVLQAVLIPSLVELLDRGDDREAEHIASSVLGLACALLTALALLGAVLAPVLMRVLLAGTDAGVRDDQVRLGTVFLWCFLPQVVFYAAGMVATAVLNARHRFGVPAFAPVLNNVVVIGCYLLFWRLRDGEAPSLDLSWVEVAVLAGGTTAGVVAFCGLPVVAARRAGFRLKLALDHRHERVRRIARLGGWAALFLAMTQLLLVTVLVLANGVEGGVVVYQVAFTFFLLPHALFALPVLTALFPPMSRQVHAEDWDGLARSVERGLRAIAFFVLPAAVGLLVASPALGEAFLFGEVAGDGVDQVSATIAAFAPGVVGYGAFLFLTRVAYATHDTRSPALVNVGVGVVGSALMAIAFGVASGDGRIPAIAAAHSVAQLGGAFVLYAVLRRRLPFTRPPSVARPLSATLASAIVAGAAVAVVVGAVGTDDRATAIAAITAGGVVGAAVYAVAQRLLGHVTLGQVRTLFAEPVDG
jgi:putative peptidoglycan lipid II flippase